MLPPVDRFHEENVSDSDLQAPSKEDENSRLMTDQEKALGNFHHLLNFEFLATQIFITTYFSQLL